MVGSTERGSTLGDAAWSELLSDTTSGLVQPSTLRDGVLATFSGPAQAMRCAEEIIAGAEG